MLLTSAEPHTSALLPASKAPSRANTATSSSTSRRQTIASVAILTLHPASKTQQGKNKRQRADEMSSDDPLAMERQHKKLKLTAKDLRNRLALNDSDEEWAKDRSSSPPKAMERGKFAKKRKNMALQDESNDGQS